MADTANLTGIPGETKIEKKAKAKKAKLDAVKEVEREESAAVDAEIMQAAAISNPVNPAMGRPTTYTPEIAAELLAHLSMGKSLRKACSQAHMPAVSTVFNWFRLHPGFSEQYTRAKEEAADAMAEDILDIADEPEEYTETVTLADGSITTRKVDNVRRTQLRIETRKWLMAKQQPRKYGDKLDLTSDNKRLPVPLLSGLTSLPPNTNDDINGDENDD